MSNNQYEAGIILRDIVIGALKERHPDYSFEVAFVVNPKNIYDSHLEVSALKENPKAGFLHDTFIPVYFYKITYARRPEVRIISGSQEDKQFIEDSWAVWLERSWRDSLLNAKNKNYAPNKNYKLSLKNTTKLKKDGGRRRRKLTRRHR
jgi:hypothetical protein